MQYYNQWLYQCDLHGLTEQMYVVYSPSLDVTV